MIVHSNYARLSDEALDKVHSRKNPKQPVYIQTVRGKYRLQSIVNSGNNSLCCLVDATYRKHRALGHIEFPGSSSSGVNQVARALPRAIISDHVGKRCQKTCFWKLSFFPSSLKKPTLRNLQIKKIEPIENTWYLYILLILCINICKAFLKMMSWKTKEKKGIIFTIQLFIMNYMIMTLMNLVIDWCEICSVHTNTPNNFQALPNYLKSSKYLFQVS